MEIAQALRQHWTYETFLDKGEHEKAGAWGLDFRSEKGRVLAVEEERNTRDSQVLAR